MQDSTTQPTCRILGDPSRHKRRGFSSIQQCSSLLGSYSKKVATWKTDFSSSKTKPSSGTQTHLNLRKRIFLLSSFSSSCPFCLQQLMLLLLLLLQRSFICCFKSLPARVGWQRNKEEIAIASSRTRPLLWCLFILGDAERKREACSCPCHWSSPVLCCVAQQQAAAGNPSRKCLGLVPY